MDTTLDITRYTIDLNKNPITGVRKGGRSNSMQIVSLKDGTEWVVINAPEDKRFCGFLYLTQAIEEAGLDIVAAKNRMVWNNKTVIYLSRYCGEVKPSFMEHGGLILKLMEQTGFKDTAGGANLRLVDGKLHVFDTEPSSFREDVRVKIEEFQALHDEILNAFKKAQEDN